MMDEPIDKHRVIIEALRATFMKYLQPEVIVQINEYISKSLSKTQCYKHRHSWHYLFALSHGFQIYWSGVASGFLGITNL